MDKQKATEILLSKLDEWEKMPKPDGYSYEKSFLEVMQGLQKELLQLSIGELPQDRNSKKKFKHKLGS
jgi:hypothetical protein